MSDLDLRLIYPPHVRNVEPPLGISLIAGELSENGVSVRCVDLNSRMQLRLARTAPPGGSTRSRRGVIHLETALRDLQTAQLFHQRDRYNSAVEYFSGALQAASAGTCWRISPGDLIYEQNRDFTPELVMHVLNHSSENLFGNLMSDWIQREVMPAPSKLIGISVGFRSQFLPALALAGIIRKHLPDQELVLGGGFWGSLPESVIEYVKKSVGHVVMGPGESFFRERFNLQETGSLFGVPDFSGYENEEYLAPVKILPLTLSRGCYWGKCAFCDEAKERFRMDHARSIRAKLSILYQQYKPELYHFTDNAIPPRVLSLLSEEPVPASWYGFVRVTEELADPEFVRRLKKNGCAMLQLGMESSSQRLLDRMRKGTQSSLYPRVLKNLSDQKIKSYVYLMFGFPGETDEDRYQTLRMLEDTPLDFLNASLFRMPPGSIISKHPDGFGVRLTGSRTDSLYHQYSYQADSMSDLRRWMSNVFLKNQAVRRITIRTPRFFKSNHAPFL